MTRVRLSKASVDAHFAHRRPTNSLIENSKGSGRCVLTIDVEDWFHILELPSTPKMSEWDCLPSRVERNFIRLLDIAEECGVRCTCFFLGWIAHRYPRLVTTAVNRGHEIASHGWAHRLSHDLTSNEFYQDAVRSKDVLQQISGRAVSGYRSAGFSLSDSNTWVFDELLRAGFVYDASLFPAYHSHGGWENGQYSPYLVHRPLGTLIEFPMTTEKVLGRPFCFFGGGYLRLFPLSIIEKMTARVLQAGRPAIFYIHPREIDPDQPRLAMSLWRRFKSYVNLDKTEAKLRHLMANRDFVPLEVLTNEMYPQIKTLSVLREAPRL